MDESRHREDVGTFYSPGNLFSVLDIRSVRPRPKLFDASEVRSQLDSGQIAESKIRPYSKYGVRYLTDNLILISLLHNPFPSMRANPSTSPPEDLLFLPTPCGKIFTCSNPPPNQGYFISLD